ncbi:hypothetical protein ANO14919_077320 [Xylariales sp. No.14919]|nr:hypothetical protein ANO14919_077320 [Xylariales sp. No.14919]
MQVVAVGGSTEAEDCSSWLQAYSSDTTCNASPGQPIQRNVMGKLNSRTPPEIEIATPWRLLAVLRA